MEKQIDSFNVGSKIFPIETLSDEFNPIDIVFVSYDTKGNKQYKVVRAHLSKKE